MWVAKVSPDVSGFDFSLQGNDSIKFNDSFQHLWLCIFLESSLKMSTSLTTTAWETLPELNRRHHLSVIQRERRYCLSSNIYTDLGTPDTCCVSIQGLHPSEEHLKANYVTTLCRSCPNSKAPPDAAHKCSFFSRFLEDALLLSLVASRIPRFFTRPKKKKEKEKMAT